MDRSYNSCFQTSPSEFQPLGHLSVSYVASFPLRIGHIFSVLFMFLQFWIVPWTFVYIMRCAILLNKWKMLTFYLFDIRQPSQIQTESSVLLPVGGGSNLRLAFKAFGMLF